MVELNDHENLDFNNNDCHLTLASLGAFFRKSLSDFPNKPQAYILPNKDKVNYFNKMSKQGIVHNVVTYSSMINVF